MRISPSFSFAWNQFDGKQLNYYLFSAPVFTLLFGFKLVKFSMQFSKLQNLELQNTPKTVVYEELAARNDERTLRTTMMTKTKTQSHRMDCILYTFSGNENVATVFGSRDGFMCTWPKAKKVMETQTSLFLSHPSDISPELNRRFKA